MSASGIPPRLHDLSEAVEGEFGPWVEVELHGRGDEGVGIFRPIDRGGVTLFVHYSDANIWVVSGNGGYVHEDIGAIDDPETSFALVLGEVRGVGRFGMIKFRPRGVARVICGATRQILTVPIGEWQASNQSLVVTKRWRPWVT